MSERERERYGGLMIFECKSPPIHSHPQTFKPSLKFQKVMTQ